MEKPTVYIESTIPSYIVSRDSVDPLIQGRQIVTRTWWEERAPKYDLVTSQFVIDEVSEGDPDLAMRRLDLLRDVPSLSLTPEVLSLGEEMRRGLKLPARAERDAFHIAVATVHGADYLLTWNCRHLANLALFPTIEAIARAAGYVPTRIGTVDELMEDPIGDQ